MDGQGLPSNLEKADLQLGKGRQFFHQILGPAASLPASWTWVSMMAFPNIPNRQALRDRGVEDACLAYILTKEELEDGESKWMKELQLGQQAATEEEYKRLVALLVGSGLVSFQSQSYDRAKEMKEDRDETMERITGVSKPGEVVGLGGGQGGLGGQGLGLGDLRGKELGHVQSIMFWNDQQEVIVDSLDRQENMILASDFGGGKTVILSEAAQQMERQCANAYFICMLDPGVRKKKSGLKNWFQRLWQKKRVEASILDVALELRFGGSGVEVVTVGRMRRELGKEGEKDVLRLLRDFMETRRGLANSMVGCSVVWCGVVQRIEVYCCVVKCFIAL